MKVVHDSVDPTLECRRRALRRRLQDRPRERWAWALGCGLPLVGIPLVVLHGWRRRTALPFLYGLTAQAVVGFVVLTLGGLPAPAPGAARPAVPGAGLLWCTLLAGGGFALGHRAGQERAASDGQRWLRLDQEG